MTVGPTAADVAIVGYGPVGQVLGALLASQGHRVCVVERYAQRYPLRARSDSTARPSGSSSDFRP